LIVFCLVNLFAISFSFASYNYSCQAGKSILYKGEEQNFLWYWNDGNFYYSLPKARNYYSKSVSWIYPKVASGTLTLASSVDMTSSNYVLSMSVSGFGYGGGRVNYTPSYVLCPIAFVDSTLCTADEAYKNSEFCFSSLAAAQTYIDGVRNQLVIDNDMTFTGNMSTVSSCNTNYYCVHISYDFCGSEFEKNNAQEGKSECCKAGFAPGRNNSCVAPMATGGTGGFSTSSYLSGSWCSEVYGSSATSTFCKDSTSGEAVSSSSQEAITSSGSEEGTSSGSDIGSSSSGDESSSSEGPYESSSSDSDETSSSSSSNDEISSSSASNVGSSSSTEINSSTSDPESGESSGSESSSSEWSYESSSSGGNETGLSSADAMSSSSTGSGSDAGESSSSSSGDLCLQYPLASVPANPRSACFSYGGKCYKCNDDRGSECANDWLWIYSFNSSNVGWWYTEVDCENGSEKTTDEGIGECPSHPLNKVPSDPQNACFASNGKCYKCNDDRGSECGNDWLWIYGFNASNVGWWYTEVDCDDPFDEEDQCPEDFYLQKKVVQNGGQLDIETSEDPVELIPQIKFYDALGRRITNSPKPKRALYTLKTNVILKMNEEISLTGERYVYIPIELFQRKSWALMKTSETVTSCGTAWNIQNDSICDSNGSWYSLGKKCGIEGVDYGVYNSEGGIDVGVYCGEVYFMAKRVSHYLVVRQSKDTIGTCADGTNLIRAKFTIPVETRILRDYHSIAPVGYQIGNNFIVSYSLHDSIDWHEKGHKRFYHCLIDENMFDPAIEFSMNVCERDFTCEGKTFDPENQEIVNSFNTSYEAEIKTIKNRDTKEWLQMCGWYHDKYGHTDGPRDPDTHQHIDPYDISCPSAEDLEKDYDLSGCEVDW